MLTFIFILSWCGILSKECTSADKKNTKNFSVSGAHAWTGWWLDFKCMMCDSECSFSYLVCLWVSYQKKSNRSGRDRRQKISVLLWDEKCFFTSSKVNFQEKFHIQETSGSERILKFNPLPYDCCCSSFQCLNMDNIFFPSSASKNFLYIFLSIFLKILFVGKNSSSLENLIWIFYTQSRWLREILNIHETSNWRDKIRFEEMKEFFTMLGFEAYEFKDFFDAR